MRDMRFVAEHRGGPLKREQHRQLMEWACECAEHVLPLYGEKTDARLTYALHVAREWKIGKATVGEARKASLGAIAAANELLAPDAAANELLARDAAVVKDGHSVSAAIAVARAVGHAVATAHMADHSLGPAWYALKAVKCAGMSLEAERKWQDECLVPEIKELVLSARAMRKI
jgi:hypothetical protein